MKNIYTCRVQMQLLLQMLLMYNRLNLWVQDLKIPAGLIHPRGKGLDQLEEADGSALGLWAGGIARFICLVHFDNQEFHKPLTLSLLSL